MHSSQIILSLKNACTHAMTFDSVTNIIGNVGNEQRDSEKSKRNIVTTILLTKKDSALLEHNTNTGVSQLKIEFIQGMWPACPGKKKTFINTLSGKNSEEKNQIIITPQNTSIAKL